MRSDIRMLIPIVFLAAFGAIRDAHARSRTIVLPAGTRTVVRTHIVAENETLAVAPGADLRFARGAGLVVRGVLMAIGTEGDSIRFSPASSGGWIGIALDPGARAIIRYARISGAARSGIAVRGGVLSLDRSAVAGNRGRNGGGIVATDGAYLSVNRTLVAGNTASGNGGGLSLTGGSTLVMARATIAGNSARSGSGAIDVDAAEARIASTIVWANDPPGIAAERAVMDVRFANIEGDRPWSGPGNRCVDPRFVDPARGDWRLRTRFRHGENSPMIGAGDPDPAYANPDGSRGNIGAMDTRRRDAHPATVRRVASRVESGSIVVEWIVAAGADVAGWEVLRRPIPSAPGAKAERIAWLSGGTAMNRPVRYWTVDASSAPWQPYEYHVVEIAHDGERTVYGPTVTALAENSRAGLAVSRANPLDRRATIRFRLPAAMPVRLVVFDEAGRTIRRLVTGRRPAGAYLVVWDGRDARGRPVRSGRYFVRLFGPGGTFVRRMMLVH